MLEVTFDEKVGRESRAARRLAGGVRCLRAKLRSYVRSSAESDAAEWSRWCRAPGGGAGLREVNARYIWGTWQVGGSQ
jgi:hypothetical protein